MSVDNISNKEIIPIHSEHYMTILPDSLYLGDIHFAKDENLLRKIGITVIIDLIDDYPTEHSNDFIHLRLPVSDQPTSTIDFAEGISKKIDQYLSQKKKVLVHCIMGMSRSVSLIIQYLMTRHNKTLKESYDFIKEHRPLICPTFGFFTGLCNLDLKLHGKNSMDLDQYAINCLSENYPFVDKDKIKDIYNEAKEIINNNPNYLEGKTIKPKFAPVGYLAYELLKERFTDEGSRNKIVKRPGCAIHHPF